MKPFIAKLKRGSSTTNVVVVNQTNNLTFTYFKHRSKDKQLYNADISLLEFVEWVRLR